MSDAPRVLALGGCNLRNPIKIACRSGRLAWAGVARALERDMRHYTRAFNSAVAAPLGDFALRVGERGGLRTNPAV